MDEQHEQEERRKEFAESLDEATTRAPIPRGIRHATGDRDQGGAARGPGRPPEGDLDEMLAHEPPPVVQDFTSGALQEHEEREPDEGGG